MPRSRNILRDRHLDQRREVHEHAEQHATTLARRLFVPADGLDPFGPDQLADDADDEHADDQQREDLLDEAPGLPQPGLPGIGVEPPAHNASTARSARPIATPTRPVIAELAGRRRATVSRNAATSSVAAVRPRAIQVQRFGPSMMFFQSLPRGQADGSSRTISSRALDRRPPRPWPHRTAPTRSRVACHASAKARATSTVATAAVRTPP
jgi:hypothetical protein